MLRALAVSAVFIFHYCAESRDTMFAAVGPYGWAGVDLFFVLSGFLVGTQFFRGLPLRVFFLKRALRTLPNFLAVLAIYFTVPFLRDKPELPPLWKFLTFTQNFKLDRATGGAFSHAWSLCVEEQFYLVLPLLSRRLLPYLLPLLFFAGALLRFWIWQPGWTANAFDERLYYPTYARLDGLIVGLALAYLRSFRPDLWAWTLRRGGWAFLPAVAFLALAAGLNGDRRSLLGAVALYPLVAVGFGALLVAALKLRHAFGLAWLARLSYAIYLVQKIVFHWSEQRFAAFTLFGFFKICALTLTAAMVLYLLVEKPFLRLRDRLGLPRRPVALPVLPGRKFPQMIWRR